MESRAFSSILTMMRAIVSTATIGNFPTLVSPDSISASAPSSTAFATSEASARVGREVSIIDSSIWVATMTGLAARRASAMDRVCTSGTSSSGSSTPRSPRATMMPSKASTISAEVVDGLRLLDLRENRQAHALLLHDRAHVGRRQRRCARTTAR